MPYERKGSEEPPRRRQPSKDPDVREMQLISAATDLAEKQIRNGTASATVITHYLKLATGRERMEREKLQSENALLRAKVESMASQKKIEELYESALKAMTTYRGLDPDEMDGDDDY